MLHALGGAIAHGVEERLTFAFALFNVLPGAHGGLEDFDGGNAAFAVLAGKQTLGNDVAEGFGEASANGLLVGKRKYSDDALDGFRGVDSVKSGQNKVARFGSFQGDLDGFTIAHLADQDDFRRLAQGGAQRQRETRRV